MSVFEGEIIRPFRWPADVVFPWLLWVECFPKWFVLCHRAALVDGRSEDEGATYRIQVSLGGLLKKSTLMRVTDLDATNRSYRFVRAEDGNRVELRFASSDDGPSGSRLTFGALYEGSGRILGVPVGGSLFHAIIERAIDRSLPRLDRLIATEEG